jgi:FtsP/CotA-like multicopper oxidase with cupredoxin domain
VYGSLYHIKNGYNRCGYLDVRGRDPGGNLLAVSTASSNTRDGLSGTWKILSARTPPQFGPVLANDLIYLQNQYNGGGSDPNERGGYLDVRGRDPGGNLLAVSTASSNTRDGLSGAWKILPAIEKPTPVEANDLIYLQNQYNGGGSDPNARGGYLDARGVLPPGGNLLGVSTTGSQNTGSTHWRFVTA